MNWIIESNESNNVDIKYVFLLIRFQIACTWEDVKSLRQDMDKIPSANAFHLRSKLLNAASHLQVIDNFFCKYNMSLFIVYLLNYLYIDYPDIVNIYNRSARENKVIEKIS